MGHFWGNISETNLCTEKQFDASSCFAAVRPRDQPTISNQQYNLLDQPTIRYDSVYLTCSKKLTCSQLSLPHPGRTEKVKENELQINGEQNTITTRGYLPLTEIIIGGRVETVGVDSGSGVPTSAHVLLSTTSLARGRLSIVGV